MGKNKTAQLTGKERRIHEKTLKTVRFMTSVSGYIRSIGPIMFPKPKTDEGWDRLNRFCSLSYEYIELENDVILRLKNSPPESKDVNFDTMEFKNMFP